MVGEEEGEGEEHVSGISVRVSMQHLGVAVGKEIEYCIETHEKNEDEER